MTSGETSQDTNDAQASLNQIVLEYMREQKRKRRWRMVFRVLIFFLILISVYRIMTLTNEDKLLTTKPHVGLIDLSGGIFDGDTGGADFFAQGLKKAYKNTNLKAMIIRINSPGGSPVQADYMFQSLRYYQKKYHSQ